jgi:hypothetical protein
MLVLLVILLGPILFFLATWGIATVYRLYFPEHPLPFEQDPVIIRERAAAQGESMPVGVREIRADQRRAQRQGRAPSNTTYHYAWGGSDGFPEAWYEDLWRRRN